MAKEVNLFSRLHKWAARQDENFLTESFAVVLEYLLARENEIGIGVIKTLTYDFWQDASDLSGPIDIRTQISTNEGRPDLEIATLEHIAVFEVKAEAEVRIGQLEGYRRYLQTCPQAKKALFLIS